MATWVIGDVQGCHDELRELLDLLKFDPVHDRLWFVGDLVNRGPKSLETLRFVKGLGEVATVVLGNHDLHLLALAHGDDHFAGDRELQPVLHAPDRDELVHWLCHRPLLHHDPALAFTLIHAGLPPQWDLQTAIACAREVEGVLRSERRWEYFRQMYGNKPNRWDPALTGMERWRFITNCFTRLRFVSRKGKLKLKLKGPPSGQKKKFMPWFLHPHRRTRGERIVFGHWSTLGYSVAENTWGIDTGCLWGGKLTALRIDLPEPRPLQMPCKGAADPLAFV